MSIKRFSLVLAPLLALVTWYILNGAGVSTLASRMGAIVVWIAVWWLTEALHLGVTSLLPFILMPMFGILKAEQVAMQYMDQIIFLFMGGFFLAYAMEKWGLHKRIAYRIIMLTGNTPSKVLLGVMLAAFFLSGWVSNTAAVMMLIPAVFAIIKQNELYSQQYHRGIATAILVGLSFSATIGGMSTLVGTPPNMIFAGVYQNTFPEAGGISFLKWMLFGFPFASSMLVVAYFVLKYLFIPANANQPFDMHYVRQQYTSLGKMCYEEKVVLAVFLTTVALWLFREDIWLDLFTVPGWSRLFGEAGSYIKDSTVVVFTSFFLFIFTSSRLNAKDERSNEKILEWQDVAKLPLNIILLFGCGFAMAKGFETSGLSNEIAIRLHGLQGLHVVYILAGIAILVTILSEFASNTASIQLVLPIIIPLAASLHINPLLLMITATFSASLGYMLPVATAANTIVYGSGEIKTSDMMKAGVLLDIAGILLLLLFMCTLGNFVFGFGLFE